MRLIQVALVLLNCAFAVEVENGVLVLNGQNFHSEIQNYDYLMVEFYATWW